MADEQQPEEQSQPPVALEQTVTNNDMVQSVRELLCKDKSTILVKATELLVLNLQQQQVILVLKQALQEAIEQKEQMLKDLHDQPVMESLMSNIEAQNHSTRKQLGDKVDSINMHLKSSETLRKQLKKEVMNLRTSIDDVKRQIHEKEETGKSLQQAGVEMVTRIEEGNKQLRTLSAEGSKLREEYQEKSSKIQNMKVGFEESVKKMQTELTEGENVLKQYAEELTIVKQQISEKSQACRQMQSEKLELQKLSEELNQNLQTEKSKLEQTFAEEKNQLDRKFTDKVDEYRRKIEEINQTIDTLTNTKVCQEESEAKLGAAVSKMVEEVNDIRDQNEKLEKELIKLKPTENLDSDSEEELTKQKPTNYYSGRPRAQHFGKSKPATRTSSTDNDQEVSCHLDNVQSSMSLDYTNRK